MRSTYIYLFGGAIGDGLFGAHIGRVLAANMPGARITLISTRRNPFVQALLAPLPFVELVEMPKGNILSWLRLLGLLFVPHKIVVLEPISGPIPLWWKLVVWSATRMPGSVEVRGQFKPAPAPSAVRVMPIAYRTENIFTTPPRILAAWGIAAHDVPPPSLYAIEDTKLLLSKPYVVLHFFAALMKRSVPPAIAHAMLEAVRAAYPNHALAVTCSAKEADAAQKIIEGVANARVFADLSAHDALQLIAGAAAFVGTDSGFTHIAQHVGVPTVVLGHHFNPAWLPMYHQPVEVLYQPEEPGNALPPGITAITPQEVVAALTKWL